MDTLESLAHRGYTEGFLRRHTHDEYQNYDYGYSISERQQFVGEFTGKRNEQGMAEVAVKNKFLLGDEVEMMTPKGNIVFKIERMLNRKNENVEAGLGDGHFVFLDVPEDVQLDYALLMRNLVNTNTRQPQPKISHLWQLMLINCCICYFCVYNPTHTLKSMTPNIFSPFRLS